MMCGVPSGSRTGARQRTLRRRVRIKGSGGLVKEAGDELALPSPADPVLHVPGSVTGTRTPLSAFRPTIRGAVVDPEKGHVARGAARRARAGAPASVTAFPTVACALGR
jgi:hypothetical protein